MEIEARVKRIIAEIMGVADSEVHNDSTIEGLGGDSLDHVETVMALEDEFDTEIPDEDGEKLVTVRQAVDYIKARAV